MIRTSAVRLGIPVRQLTFRILVPLGFILMGLVALLSIYTVKALHDRSAFEHQVTVKTLFETQASIHASRNGLAVLAQNRGYERIWILSATGDILDSNRNADIGTRLDERWWNPLKDEDTGFVQQQVDFGSQKLSLTALHHEEMGRWVVIVSKPSSIWSLTVLYVGLILIVGLIIWLLAASLIWITLSHRVASPLQKLDERTVELVEGSSLTEAALEKLLAETGPALGGHADYVIDLARRLKKADEKSVETLAGFKHLFNSIPSLAFIHSEKGKITLANKALSSRLGVEPIWIEGQPLNMLKGVVPVEHLEHWFSKKSAMKVGLDRMELYPAPGNALSEPIVLSIQPIYFQQEAGHLVVIEEKGKEDAGVVSERVSDSASDIVPDSVSRRASDSKDDSPTIVSGDGASQHAELSVSQSSSLLLEGLMEATGQFVVVFNEEAKTVFWSPAASYVTGISLVDIPDMKAFTEKVFATRQEKKLFKAWIDGEPDERSQELKVKTTDGSITSRWYASEIDIENSGSVGVLWAQLDTHPVRRPASKREPVAS